MGFNSGFKGLRRHIRELEVLERVELKIDGMYQAQEVYFTLQR